MSPAGDLNSHEKPLRFEPSGKRTDEILMPRTRFGDPLLRRLHGPPNFISAARSWLVVLHREIDRCIRDIGWETRIL